MESAIAACISYIKKQQGRDGSFPSVTSSQPKNPRGKQNVYKSPILNGINQKTPFTTSLILNCTAEANDHKEVIKIANKAIPYLLSERSKNWTWNYWPRLSQKNKETPVPDDLDDTFCALSAIHLHNKNILKDETFPEIIKILTHTEIKVGGPYNTWLVSDIHIKPWNDIDIVVNSNVGYFLKLLDVEIPSLFELAKSTILKNKYKTRYYKSPISILYFISRLYSSNIKKAGAKPESKSTVDSKVRNKAIKDILKLQKPTGNWSNPLETAMAISALLNFGYLETNNKQTGSNDRLSTAVNTLVKSAHSTVSSSDSIWQPYPCYIEESKEYPAYAGATTLTAAFVLEALVKYQKTATQDTEASAAQTEIKEKNETVIRKVKSIFETTSPFIKNIASKYIDSILKHDKLLQVPLLPYHTYKSFNKETADKIDKKTLIDLGVANTLGWLAYTLYDDVLDTDAGPELIPTANIAMREVMNLYSRNLSPDHFQIFKKIMNGIDEANNWEHSNCLMQKNANSSGYLITKSSLPDYKDLSILAEKSLGHALGPITLLLQAGFTANSNEVKQMRLFFKHYIIARQLNDDAHDWIEDLNHGFINSVSTKVLSNFFIKSKLKTKLLPYLISDNKTKSTLQKIFWNDIIDIVSLEIHTHIKKASNALKKMKSVQDRIYYQSLLAPIKLAAEEAITERDKTQKFLKTYN